jgi:hypothetical protein
MRRARELVVMTLLTLAALPSPVGATFHLMSISEIGAGFGGDPAVQFVELRLDNAGQTNTTSTRLTAFDAAGNATVLVLSDHGVTNGTSGRNILYATTAFTTASGVTPDFVIPANIATPTGMICWGAPGAVPPDPATWDAEKPNNYVDCVAYGAFAGATRLNSGTPTTLAPGDGTQSLARTKGSGASGSNTVDFALAAPNVCNNAGDCTDLSDGGTEVCGDADGSGSVNVTDGVQTLRAAAGLPSPCTLARCDVNGNGEVSVTDGVQVLRGAAGLPLSGTCTPASQ